MIRKASICALLCVWSLATAFGAHRTDLRAFTPSLASLLAQNDEAARLGLRRIQDKAELQELVQAGELVRFRTSSSLRVHIPDDRAYARPWVVLAVADLSQDFFLSFRKPLQVNSAVRTVKFQTRLRKQNRNAAPAWLSVHPTGIAVDLRRHGLTPAQKSWMQLRLLFLSGRGLVIVEEELRNGSCFHVVVLGGYTRWGYIEPTLEALPVEL